MKKLLLLLMLLPVLSMAQPAGVLAPQSASPKLLEGFAQAGYVHELWVLSSQLSYGYSSLSYTGNGFYAGGGLRSRTNANRPLGFGLSLDYLQYNMDKTLSANEGVQRKYAFARFTPMVYYMFPIKSAFSISARGDIALLAPISNNERGYAQLGLKGCVGYKQYELNLGFNFSQRNNSPATATYSKWREQTFTLGLVCFPYRFAVVRSAAKKPSKMHN